MAVKKCRAFLAMLKICLAANFAKLEGKRIARSEQRKWLPIEADKASLRAIFPPFPIVYPAAISQGKLPDEADKASLRTF